MGLEEQYEVGQTPLVPDESDGLLIRGFTTRAGSWTLIQTATFRSSYLNALREADSGNIEPLVWFARS